MTTEALSPRSTSCRGPSGPGRSQPRVEVGRGGLELGGARVHRLVRADQPLLGVLAQRQGAQLVQVPGVDAGARVQRGHVVAAAEGLEHQLVAVPGRDLERGQQRLVVGRRRGAHVQLARAPGLHPRLLERAADGHRLAHRLHVGGQLAVLAGELLEREPGPLDHHVVDGGLERRGRDAGDVVVDLLERVADRQPRGDLGDREPGGLGRQRGRARHARVHLDDDDLVGLGVHGELHVGAAGLDPDGADHGDGLVAQRLVLDVARASAAGPR